MKEPTIEEIADFVEACGKAIQITCDRQDNELVKKIGLIERNGIIKIAYSIRQRDFRVIIDDEVIWELK